MFTRLCVVAALVCAGLAIAAPAAHAVAPSPVCDAFNMDANGNPKPPAIATGNQLPPLDIPSLGGSGLHVPTGSTFPVVTGSTTATLPSQTTTKVGGNDVTLGINEIKNIVLHFKINGAAAVSKATVSGGDVVGANVVTTNTSLTLTLPGTKATGSTLPKGSAYFPGGASFTTPTISLKVTAPNTPGTISTSLDSLTIMTSLSLGAVKLSVFLDCTVAANTIGSVSVVEPGAPVAIDDAFKTPENTAITMDVLKNDLPNDDGTPPDPSTLSIIENPKHGTASVTDDHKIAYTPDHGFSGADSLQYQVCVVTAVATTSTSTPTSEPKAQPLAATTTRKCDPGVVSITVTATEVAAAATTTTTPPTTIPPTELPHTGSSSGPTVWLALGLSVLGLALLLGVRRPRSYAVLDRE
jgi:LPXTG-motif cell wall-anchored protein